jgi:hypothetical protein
MRTTRALNCVRSQITRPKTPKLAAQSKSAARASGAQASRWKTLQCGPKVQRACTGAHAHPAMHHHAEPRQRQRRHSSRKPSPPLKNQVGQGLWLATVTLLQEGPCPAQYTPPRPGHNGHTARHPPVHVFAFLQHYRALSCQAASARSSSTCTRNLAAHAAVMQRLLASSKHTARWRARAAARRQVAAG